MQQQQQPKANSKVGVGVEADTGEEGVVAADAMETMETLRRASQGARERGVQIPDSDPGSRTVPEDDGRNSGLRGTNIQERCGRQEGDRDPSDRGVAAAPRPRQGSE